jgi:leucyl-tRNA synthetase
MEHADKHLIYARFISHYLHSKGLLKSPEPFDTLITQGLVRGLTYYHTPTKKYLSREDASKIDESELRITIEKMSKSKLNGLSPVEVIEKYGKDAVKMFVLGDVPVEKDLDFLENGIESVKRKLDKWQFFFDYLSTNYALDPLTKVFKTHGKNTVENQN